MKRWVAIFGSALVVGTAPADDIKWTSSVPLWKGLSPSGQLVDAGPAPPWTSPPPAAALGHLSKPPRPAPIGTSRPLELPPALTAEKGPSLPPLEATNRRERFASAEIPAARLVLPRR